MNNTAELVKVIKASNILTADNFDESVRPWQPLIEKLLDSPGASNESIAAELTNMLVSNGLVMSDEDSVLQVIEGYLESLGGASGLSSDDMDFLNNFLK